MDQAWHELLATDWPQLRAICERDVVHRVGAIGEHGWATAIESLHPSIAWRAGGIEIGFFPPAGTVRLSGDGLLLIPSVFVGNITAHLEDPWPRTLVYSARGTAALRGEQAAVPRSEALSSPTREPASPRAPTPASPWAAAVSTWASPVSMPATR
ncbi:hypothetical protein ACIPSH_20110 [Streptomyces iakyrus]|uniref:hypothetical protein n=1 Tax=Streptomyces iakyrus TaxID=68219 RepID=UPI003816DE10